MVRLAWRLQRPGLIAAACFAGFAALVQGSSFSKVAGSTPAARHAFATQMSGLGSQLSYLLPPPVHAETVGGYLQWRLYGLLTLIVAVWAVVSAAGAARGDEDRGLVAAWLAAGVSRAWLIFTRLAALAAAVIVVAALTALCAAIGAAAGQESLGAGGLIWQSINLVALTLCLNSLGLLVAQVARDRRSAASLGGFLVSLLFFTNSLSRSAPWLAPAAWFTPFHYYELSRPVDPRGAADLGAITLLLGAAATLAALAAAAFTYRDLGESLFSPRGRARAGGRCTTAAQANPMLRFPVLAGLYENRAGLASWIAVSILLSTFITSIAHMTALVIRGTPGLRGYRAALGSENDLTLGVIALVVFGIAQTIVIIYALTHVAGWASEDADGRLELILSQPVARPAVVLERAGRLVAGLSMISAAMVLTVAAVARTQGASIAPGRLLEAAALLVGLGLVFGGAGAAVIARLPRSAVRVLGAYAGITFLIQQFGPLAQWPAWIMDLSILRLGGQPLAGRLDWAGMGVMAALVATGFGAAIIAMQRREVGR